jgi:hypothetical protein
VIATDEVMSTLDHGSAAELLVARAYWRHADTDHVGAVLDVTLAARKADASEPSVRTGPARRAVRDAIAALRNDDQIRALVESALEDLPEWATAELPQRHLDFLNQWLAAARWPAREDLIRHSPSLLKQITAHGTLTIAIALYPDAGRLVELREILDAAVAHDFEHVLGEHRNLYAATATVDEWLATPTWDQDLNYLSLHPELRHDDLPRRLLASRPTDAAARQHLAILDLIRHLPAAEIYEAITDPATAADTAMDLLEQGHLEALPHLLLAAPALTSIAFVTPYLLGVLALSSGDPGTDEPSPDGTTPTPHDLFALAARQGTPFQLAAAAARLKTLARRRPRNAKALLESADQLTIAPPQAVDASDAG